MGFFKNPFKGRQPGNATAPAPTQQPASQQAPAASQPQGPNTGPLMPAGNTNGSPSIQKVQKGDLNLVNYSPEELIQHVDRELNRVQFGWPWNIKFMENYSEIWSLAGPIVLLAGTIGEVFLVLWLRQKVQDVLAGISIVAVALVLEGTFLAVSYKAATMRNRAARRQGGPTLQDKRELRHQLYFWIALAAGVCVTQVVFIAAQTKPDGIGEVGVWFFALARAVFTLVADGYTAFAHKEKPTTAERALEEQEQRAQHAKKLLDQKTSEITLVNAGILSVRQAHTEAQIKEDKLQTQLEVEKLENRAHIDTLKNQQEQAAMFTKLGNNIMRALFDPSLPDEQREKLLGVMQGFMGASRALPPEAGRRTIREIQDTEDEA